MVFVDTKTAHVIGGNRSIINYGNLTRINVLGQYIEEHPMLLMFSRGFKDIVTKTAFFKNFPGLENKFQNSRGFKEIKDPYIPCMTLSQLHNFLGLSFYQHPGICSISTIGNTNFTFDAAKMDIVTLPLSTTILYYSQFKLLDATSA